MTNRAFLLFYRVFFSSSYCSFALYNTTYTQVTSSFIVVLFVPCFVFNLYFSRRKKSIVFFNYNMHIQKSLTLFLPQFSCYFISPSVSRPLSSFLLRLSTSLFLCSHFVFTCSCMSVIFQLVLLSQQQRNTQKTSARTGRVLLLLICRQYYSSCTTLRFLNDNSRTHTHLLTFS